MSETTVLKSSASPKNASPHMAGGKNHVQIAPKPMVNVTMANNAAIQQTQKNKNVVVGQPQRAIAVRASAPQRQQQPELGDGGGGGAPGNSPAVAPGAPKPMIQVRMDGKTPKVDSGSNGINRGNVVILNRGGGQANRQIARRQGNGPFAQRSQAQAAQARAALPAGRGPVMQPVQTTSGMSADQLMCCRHAVNQYIKDQGEGVNEIVADLAKSTLAAIDAELGARANYESAIVEPEVEVEVEVQVPQRRQVTAGGGARSGVAAPRRFDGRGAAPVRRVVPAPAPAPIEVADVNDGSTDSGERSFEESFEGSSTADGADGSIPSDVIDVEPNS